MTTEASRVGLHDHERFLQAYPPFSGLDARTLGALVRDLEVLYRPSGAALDVSGGLFIVRRGELSLNGEEYSEGETVGGGVRTGQARALVDTWLYVMPPEKAGQWLSNPTIQHFLTSALSSRLNQPGQSLDLSSVPVGDVMRPAELATPDMTVQQAAAKMREHRISSLMVKLEGGVFGIITDKDLRNRVLAEGLPPSTPVSQVMTVPARTLPDEQPALSALNFMFRHNIRHLPIVRGGELVGILGTADLLRLQTQGVGYVVQDLLDAEGVDELMAYARKLPEYTANLYRAGQRAEHLSRLASYAYDALYRRTLQLVEQELGPAPGPYAWVLLGSIARRESGLNPDQDHHLVIADEVHRPYFQPFARRVEDILVAAGLPACEGGIMASRHTFTLDEYIAKMREWQSVPDPQALLNVTIFFDPRVVAGDLEVRAGKAARLAAGQNPAFMAHLTRLAVGHRPPLGFRQRIRTAPDDTLDLKIQGLALIIDLARLHALRVGEQSASTFVRLKAPGESLLHPDTREDLLGAYRYLLDLRMELQMAQLTGGQPLSTRLPIDDLSGPQQVHLREIYKLIGRVQSVLAPQVGGV
ncbi:CBS domain-containing protein [Deinococcus cavernae]|uniref:CBS domain-containing protein n=1 Tax=Deinococcus cavernae TaxID=2320857 RepID=A0A418V9B8_9DEIO|nr:DUF294 nucleotidyltransferase-like domain-containing protein [Deinococcus cavernae]RJF72647.1 CBS domain-containing protein [Deinococcus cavernae]